MILSFLICTVTITLAIYFGEKDEKHPLQWLHISLCVIFAAAFILSACYCFTAFTRFVGWIK